ncbi:LysR family transcriptional regulator [Neptunomonas phycophila]|uniref:LysR family transcriptional regulator n=1 Tax=Neptunomonas phycophila TaxID=1572645 RepID=A0ABT9EUS1_9GAMM|nr:MULTISPECIES: LysR family transcriptional regulator [Neptunomonas]MDN2658933.1 LysR family transcriptional regulator [Neptunomonas sp. CHC150]MDP2522808.1 LysR family transcriptional regulator [Neptunomonas phycophila]
MKHLNMRALEFISAIDRYGSLRKAALKLNVDPSAVSRSISALEDSLETKILVRKGNASHITSSGRELITYFRKVQAFESQTISNIKDLTELRSGEVKIAIGEGFITDLISSSLQSFLVKYPGIQLGVDMAGAKEAIQLLEDDRIDFAVTYASQSHPGLECLLETLHPLDIIAPANHPLTQLNRPIDVREVIHHSLALIDHSTGMGRLVSLAEEEGGFVLSPRLKTNSVAVLKNFVVSGSGISFMPRLTVKSEVDAGLISIVETTHPVLSRAKVRVLSQKGRQLTPAAQELFNHLLSSTRFLKIDVK